MELNQMFLLVFVVQCIAVSAQVITTVERTFVVDEGDTVDLPCNVEELDSESAVVIWKRERDTILFLDEDRLEADQRLQLLKNGHNYTLSIQNVEPYDAATYYCGITVNSEVEIAHTLKVRVPPSISISPPTTPLLVKENEDVSLRCLASGNPQPKVLWRRKNNVQLSPTTKTLDGRLKITALRVADSGIYECVANNGVKGTAVKEIEVVVQAAPWVETDSSYVPVSPHANINLTCRYNGQPAPEAEWWYNSFKINKYDKRFENAVEYGVRRDNYTEAILELKNLEEEDYGDYTCRISNGLGSAEKTIHLSARPGPPLLVLRDNLLSWSVQSAEPITEYKILYRKIKEDGWNREHIVRASREDQHGSLWEHKIDVTTFLPSGADFELQITAKNALGYGSLAQDYVTVSIPVRQIEPKSGTRSAITLCVSKALFVFSILLFFF